MPLGVHISHACFYLLEHDIDPFKLRISPIVQKIFIPLPGWASSDVTRLLILPILPSFTESQVPITWLHLLPRPCSFPSSKRERRPINGKWCVMRVWPLEGQKNPKSFNNPRLTIFHPSPTDSILAKLLSSQQKKIIGGTKLCMHDTATHWECI
jgi:hypothetical protein